MLKGERKGKRTLTRRAWASYSEQINGGELSADGWAVWVSESTRDWDEGLTSWAREEKGRGRRRGVGLAGLARLAVGRRSASRRRLLRLLTCGPALTVRCALGRAGGGWQVGPGKRGARGLRPLAGGPRRQRDGGDG